MMFGLCRKPATDKDAELVVPAPPPRSVPAPPTSIEPAAKKAEEAAPPAKTEATAGTDATATTEATTAATEATTAATTTAVVSSASVPTGTERTAESRGSGSMSGGEASSSSAPPKGFIERSQLGPAQSLMDDSLPEWSIEMEAGKWKTYNMMDSLQLDRFWKAFECSQEARPNDVLASVFLMKKEVTVNFQTMMCEVAGGRPRRIKRSIHNPGWLTNKFFFRAFVEALERAGVVVENQPEEMFDFRFNQDFRELKDDGRKLLRGGQQYRLPIGWKRFAVNVKGLYDDGSNDWLKEDESGWAVAYHGTSGDSLPGILCSGFRVGDRQKFEKDTGAGIYCAPTMDVAQHYSKPKKLDGRWVQVVLQLRVKPSAIRLVADPKATEFEKKYWVINDPDHIRAYGVLIREFHLKDYVPPEVMVFGSSHPEVKKLLKALQTEAASD